MEISASYQSFQCVADGPYSTSGLAFIERNRKYNNPDEEYNTIF
jgi:hypothetical protein